MPDNPIEHLIVDRTQADVNLSIEAHKNQSYSSLSESLRGSYNYTDLNRVESACRFLRDYLISLKYEISSALISKGVADSKIFDPGIDIPELTFKTDWSASDNVTVEQSNRYLGNLSEICSQIPVSVNIPRSLGGLKFEDANNIEKAILSEFDAAVRFLDEKLVQIENTAQGFFYSGEFQSGEGIL